jgi:hypothetical protein
MPISRDALQTPGAGRLARREGVPQEAGGLSCPARGGVVPFDELAKELARGSGAAQLGRREALRRLGDCLAGALLASLGLAGASVRPARADDCFSQCGQSFGHCFEECEGSFAQEMETGGRLHRMCLAECGEQDAPCKRACAEATVRRFGSARHTRVACETRCSDEHAACADRCPCPPGQSNCRGVCVNTATDPSHCGACANVCVGGTRCIDGQCRCPRTLSFCDDRCVDTASYTLHCGGCGRVCRPYEFCSSGQCVCGEPGLVCASGLTCCAGGPGTTRVSAACTDLRSDARNCGRCDLPCRMPDGRSYGVCCRGVCCAGYGFDCCGGECIDVLTDTRHCGACGTSCAAYERCYQGQCLRRERSPG